MEIGHNRYSTIKEAIKYSTEPYGLIAIYVDADGEEYYFINGKPHKIVVV